MPRNCKTERGAPGFAPEAIPASISGMDVSAWLVPVLTFAVGLGAGAMLALRSRAGSVRSQEREAAAALARAEALEREGDRLQVSLREKQEETLALGMKLATAEEANRLLGERLAEDAGRLREMQDRMKLEFEALASRLLEEKSSRFLDQNQQNLSTLLSPLKDRLADFRERLETLHGAGEKSSAELRGELKTLRELNRKISEEARDLTQALRGQSKAQGSWGELVLERILEKSGLTKGAEYETQWSLKDEEGGRRMPDVVIRLPEGRHLLIDAKVSLTAYERLCAAESESEKEAARREHVGSVRRHVEELSAKDYPKLEELQTPDFVLMFLPVETALHEALQADPGLYLYAFDRNVVLVSSSTLLIALRAVESVWRRHKQTLNAQEIARQAGRLHDAFALFVSSLEEIGNRLDQARAAYEQSLARLSTGKGNLVRRVMELEKLGARAEKTLPQTLVRRASEDV